VLIQAQPPRTLVKCLWGLADFACGSSFAWAWAWNVDMGLRLRARVEGCGLMVLLWVEGCLRVRVGVRVGAL